MAQPFLPRYEVISRLGEGGVGTVYKVRDLKEGSLKALKALKHANGRQLGNVQRFQEEYRILRSLHHPSLPEVFDYGITPEKTQYIVMEFVAGEPFDAYYKSHPDEKWLLLFQLSEAVAFIHEHDLLHLDLKPSNLLVRKTRAYGGGQEPLVMLLDFGVSYRRERASKAAQVGTPAYMAPEIIQNEGPPTRAVDYYSLGATLFELIEGKPPFKGTLEEVLKAHLEQCIEFKTERAEYVEIYPLVKRLTDKDSKERLEAFDDFRTSVALKVSGELATLEQAYGMGYLDSLTVVGKEEVWQRLKQWVANMGTKLSNRDTGSGLYESGIFKGLGLGEGWTDDNPRTWPLSDGPVVDGHTPLEPAGNMLQDTDSLYQTTTVPLDSFEHDLKQEVPGEQIDPGGATAEQMPRCMVISGAPGSGKSYLVEALKAELQLRGIASAVLGDGGEYETIVSNDNQSYAERAAHSIDPQALIIDRFVRGWEHLAREASGGGMVLIVDAYERAGKEVREFLEYVSRRLELTMDEGSECGIFVLVTGRRPQLKRDIESNLPKREAEELVVPPPGREEVERILAQFHGHMPGVEDRQRLKEYLLRESRSSGALIDRLKEALLRGDLVRSGGHWGFSWTPAKVHASDEPRENYYQALLHGLQGSERELIQWLSCNRGWLYVDEFLALTGMSGRDLTDSLERIRPYRVIDLTTDKDRLRIGIVSRSVRMAFYRAIDPDTRARLHKAYIDYLSKKKLDSQRFCRFMIYHREQVGDAREAFRVRITSLRGLTQSKDVFSIRQSCSEGIAFCRKLTGRDEDESRWHIERHFIKQWIEAEWMVTNFKSLIDIVKTHVIGRNRQIPLSFCYKYATALERTGELKACRELITSTRKRIHNKSSEAYVLISLVDANVLYVTGAYDASIKMLKRLERQKSTISPAALSRIYILFMLNYQNLGVTSMHERYMKRGEKIANRIGHYEHVLAASYSRVLSYFNSSLYEKAKKTLRYSIRIAAKHRVYRRLCSMYFLASAVYYEEGNYKSAIKFLDKAVRVAMNMGMQELVNEYMLRYALIYQNLGYYGNAIRFAETVKNQVPEEYRSNHYFFALLILLDLHNSVRNDKAAIYKQELDSLAGSVEAKYRLALYHLLSGDYLFDHQDYDEAYQEYDLAYNMYEDIAYQDDAARCLIRMTNILVEEGDFAKASVMLERAHPMIKKMESEDLSAEYQMANLALHLTCGADSEKIGKYLDGCEGMWPRISDINIRIKMFALLFRAHVSCGRSEMAVTYFNQYYAQLKQITSNLPNTDYVDQFVRHREFISLVNEFKALSNRYPNQPVS